MAKSATMDMTRGSSLSQLVRFSVPLILGNVFQLAYNMVDTAVIGRCAGSTALAAVGTCDPVMNLIILGVSGVCIGASVLMGNFFGAKELDRLREELRTTVTIGLIFAAVIMAAGLPAADLILRWMRVQPEAMGEAGIYLRIIFAGMPFTCLYNIYAAALRSVGDSKTPVRYLAMASVMNMLLDLLFVAVFGWGAAGAGSATVLAEAVSAVLCITHVSRRVPELRIDWRRLGIDRSLAGQTLSYGGLTALQQCSQPIGNLLIQGAVNGLGVTAAAAFSAVRKIEDIGLIPGRSVSTAVTAFTAQNEGAGEHERTERGFAQAMGLELLCGTAVCAVILLLRGPLMAVFTEDTAIRELGTGYFSVIAFFYWLACLANGHQGYFRGVKLMRTVLFGTLTQISVRVIVTLLLVPRMGIAGVGIACCCGWSCQLLWQGIWRCVWSRGRRKREG